MLQRGCHDDRNPHVLPNVARLSFSIQNQLQGAMGVELNLTAEKREIIVEFGEIDLKPKEALRS